MTVNELIHSVDFDDAVVPLLEIDQRTGRALFSLREIYDYMRHGEPEETDGVISVVMKTDPSTGKRYVDADVRGNDSLGEDLGKEVVVSDEVTLSPGELLARVLWALTMSGTTPEERKELRDGGPAMNKYERKAEEIERRMFDNYARTKFGLNREHPDYPPYSLSPAQWDESQARQKRRNRAKRMRDARQYRALSRFRRLGKIYNVLTKVKVYNHRVDWDRFKYLFSSILVREYTFHTRCYDPSERENYLWDLVFKYGKGIDWTEYDHFIFVIVTSRAHPFEKPIDTLYNLMDIVTDIDEKDPSQVALIEGRDESLGEEALVYVAASRQLPPHRREVLRF